MSLRHLIASLMGGQLSLGLDEVPMEGLGRCEDVGKHFGMLGDCEAAKRGGALGGELGGKLGDCQAANRGLSREGSSPLRSWRSVVRQAGRVG